MAKTKKELIEQAEGLGLKVNSDMTKKDIKALIDNAPKQDETPAEETVTEETATEEVASDDSAEVVEPQEDPEADTFVTIESADKRQLEVSINGNTYKGEVIEVPARLEGEIRRILLEGHFLLK